MSLSELVESKAYKNIMKYVYGWGAAVVLTGALFKIQHWPGAGPMLTIGMAAEVLIFFLSAFEPLHEEVDWTLVYPELAGMTDDFDSSIGDRDDRRGSTRDSRLMNLSEMTPPRVDVNYNQDMQNNPNYQQTPVYSGGGGFSGDVNIKGLSSLENLDKMLSKADLDPNLFTKLGQGIEKMSGVANKFEQLDGTIDAAGSFANSMATAAKAAEGLSDVCVNSTDVLKDSISQLSESYMRSTDVMNKTGEQVAGAVQQGITTMVDALSGAGNKLVENMGSSEVEMRKAYGMIVEQLQETTKGISEVSKGYSQNLEKQNNNLSAINSIYEMYLQNLTQQMKYVEEINEKSSQLATGVTEGLQQTITYKEELSKLNNQLSQLNEVYGSMLSTVTMNDN